MLDIADDGTIFVTNGGDQGERCDPAHPFRGGIFEIDGTPGGKPIAKGFRNPISVRCLRGYNRCYAIELSRDYTAAIGGPRKARADARGRRLGLPLLRHRPEAVSRSDAGAGLLRCRCRRWRVRHRPYALRPRLRDRQVAAALEQPRLHSDARRVRDVGRRAPGFDRLRPGDRRGHHGLRAAGATIPVPFSTSPPAGTTAARRKSRTAAPPTSPSRPTAGSSSATTTPATSLDRADGDVMTSTVRDNGGRRSSAPVEPSDVSPVQRAPTERRPPGQSPIW